MDPRRISITELSAHLEGHGEEMRRIAELEARMGPSARDIPLQQREDAATIMQQQFRVAASSPVRKQEQTAAATIQAQWRERNSPSPSPPREALPGYRQQRVGRQDPPPTRTFEERNATPESLGNFGPPPRGRTSTPTTCGCRPGLSGPATPKTASGCS